MTQQGSTSTKIMPRYRSKLEGKVAKLLGDGWEYEKKRVDYSVSHCYTPDFTKGSTYIEVKGFFRPGDQTKYKAIKEVLDGQGIELFFVFSNPNKPVRKGAKLTHGGWCDKCDIRYCAASEVEDS